MPALKIINDVILMLFSFLTVLHHRAPIINGATLNVDIAASQELFVHRLQMHGEQYKDNLVLKRIHKARRRNATCMGKKK